MEDYKKKYEQALERGKKLGTSEMPLDPKRSIGEQIFSELAESENDRIRKNILALVKKHPVNHERCQMEAYLEKLKENPKSADSISSDCASSVKCEDEKIRKAIMSIIAFSPEAMFNRVSITRDNCFAWLEKQGEQKPNDKIQIGKKYKCIASPIYSTFMIGKIYKSEDKFLCSLMNFCSDCFEPIEDGKQKPADKIDPKFKVSDWIYKDGTMWRIIGISDKEYILAGKPDVVIREPIHIIDSEFRLWSIADAKNGDVLVSGQMTILFKKFEEDSDWNFVIAYAGIDISGKLQINDEHWLIGNETKPATKEQRDLLFQEMKEAGYEWNDDKKELKKIEQKSAWSEEDETFTRDAVAAAEEYYTKGCGQEELVVWLKSLKDRLKGE